MKVGTDGVLLGAWAQGGHRVLDIGTGTGLIALMMSQRFPQALIDAIEIDHDAAVQAAENVACSPFADRIKVSETALQNFKPTTHYNIIVTNPPFFAHSLRSPSKSRSLARQTESLPFSAIFSFATEYLVPDGSCLLSSRPIISMSSLRKRFCGECSSRDSIMSGPWSASRPSAALWLSHHRAPLLLTGGMLSS